MDDTCAVCAETLDSVAYGQCGHREVCFTCIVRLRFICDDRRCCLCKSESSVIFVTKALGDYTRVIKDFSSFPADPSEGQVGEFWYHEGAQAFFDDLDHYKMIKAMCRLSCGVCDNTEGNSKRRGNFRNIEQLKGHLFHQHALVMCSLCLEGRKVFIYEQKLYTKEQLKQHINTGDSEVDGNETERGGFMGHPKCEFCRTPFYGDNELYTHMSTEHYTCHICQRQHPGQYEYYRNYDELEAHFRTGHFLCEDEGCLAKKFVVFASELEMKVKCDNWDKQYVFVKEFHNPSLHSQKSKHSRHNATEHGGRMSRSKRSAVLQIPTSFRFQRSVEEDRRRRGREHHPDHSDAQLSLAIQASLETSSADISRGSSFGVLASLDHRETSEADSILRPLASLTTRDSEPSRIQVSSTQISGNAPLEESSFPPLPGTTRSSQQTSRNASRGARKNTMAARLRQKGAVNVIHSSHAWPAAQQRPITSMNTSNSSRISSSGSIPLSTSASSTMVRSASANGVGPSNHASTSQNGAVVGNVISPSNASSVKNKAAAANGVAPVNYGSSSGNTTGWTNGSHSTQALNLANGTSSTSLLSAFPPISATKPKNLASSNQPFPKLEDVHASKKPLVQNHGSGGSLKSDTYNFPPISANKLDTSSFPPVSSNKSAKSSQPLQKVEDIKSANKSLVERIRACLGNDEDTYSAFREMSVEYRQGIIGTGEYLAYVHQFDLAHLIPELARLCPDPCKQKELLEASDTRFVDNDPHDVRHGKNSKHKKGSKKGKEKCEDGGFSASSAARAESYVNRVRELHSGYKPSETEVEILSKDGYRSDKGKSKIDVTTEQASFSSADHSSGESKSQMHSQTAAGSKKTGEGSKKLKKTSKFDRVRLGLNNSHSGPDNTEATSDAKDPSDELPIRGAWKNGGGHKLVKNLR